MRGQSVLVVEDEFLIAMDLEQLLTTNGWRVLGPVATVAAALHIVEQDRPDVAVLDISLRGRELVTPVAEALRRLKVPFVVASAHPIGHIFKGAEVLAEAPALGKPTDARRLLLTLDQLLPGETPCAETDVQRLS